MKQASSGHKPDRVLRPRHELGHQHPMFSDLDFHDFLSRLPAMGYVTSLFARKMVAAAGERSRCLPRCWRRRDRSGRPMGSEGDDPCRDLLRHARTDRRADRRDRSAGARGRLHAAARIRRARAGLQGRATTLGGVLSAGGALCPALDQRGRDTSCGPIRAARSSSCTGPANGGWGCGCRTRRRWRAPCRIARQVCPVPFAPLEVLVRHPAPKTRCRA